MVRGARPVFVAKHVGSWPWLCKNALLDLILAIRFSCDLREARMRRFVEGMDCVQSTLFPECLEDWIGENNPVRVIDVFVDELDLAALWI